MSAEISAGSILGSLPPRRLGAKPAFAPSRARAR
jgi:hypothetical protein